MDLYNIVHTIMGCLLHGDERELVTIVMHTGMAALVVLATSSTGKDPTRGFAVAKHEQPATIQSWELLLICTLL